jgi:hypothetical protein
MRNSEQEDVEPGSYESRAFRLTAYPLKVRWATAVGSLVAALSSCSPSESHPPPASDSGACVFGDPTKPMELELAVIGPGNARANIDDGADVPLVFPPQGGRVVFVGVRVTNIDACEVQLTGAMRDEATKQVRVDARTILLRDAGGGFAVNDLAQGSPDISSFSNVPVCPNQWASSNAFDHEFELSVTLKDKSGRTGTKTIHVTPRCAEPDRLAECLCICKVGYRLGEPCSGADGGAGSIDAASDALEETGDP